MACVVEIRKSTIHHVPHAHPHIPDPVTGCLLRRGTSQHPLHLLGRPRLAGDFRLRRALQGNRAHAEHRPHRQTARFSSAPTVPTRSAARRAPASSPASTRTSTVSSTTTVPASTARSRPFPNTSKKRDTKPPSSASGTSSAIPPDSTTGKFFPAREVITIRTSSR
jgi:hypothetical protein